MLIKMLDPAVSNMIAAGEVVERPASAVKELCENSIDAGASIITVEISVGGIKYIRISDNGVGIYPDDIKNAFLRHATSKIYDASDLEAIMTLGFRGEALASIAAVANIEIHSRPSECEFGTIAKFSAGELIYKEESGCALGTTIIIENLFFNTPARMKFLKKDYTESGYVEEVLRKLSLSHTEISFRFIADGKEKLFTPGDATLQTVAHTIYGKEISSNLIEISYANCDIRVSGLIGKNTIYRKNRSYETFFINGRCIVNKTITVALEEAYKGLMQSGQYPIAILKLNIDPTKIDVNIHPAKLEVKFSDEKAVYHAVYWAVKNALATPIIPRISENFTPKREVYVNRPIVASTASFREIDEGAEYKKSSLPQHINLNLQNITPIQTNIPTNPPILKKEYTQTGINLSEIGDYRIVGQIFNTYIIVEHASGMMLIDQHASHERIIYERLLEQSKNNVISPQLLLVPDVVTLTPIEYAYALENLDFFINLGFEVQEFGNNDIVVRSVPTTIDVGRIGEVLSEIISYARGNKYSTTTALVERALYTVACRAAIKANKKLSNEEIQQLVRDVLHFDTNMTCPHGRPVSVIVDKSFIEKRFGRIK